MGDKSPIEWTDATWNPIRGCSRVSEGCRYCYAERVAARFSGPGMPYEGLAQITPAGPRWTGEVRLIESHLEDPLRWKKPRRIFVNSMSDLFHEKLSDEAIDRVFAVMGACDDQERGHIFQVLTKRPTRMVQYMRTRAHTAWNQRRLGRSAFPPRNVWLGVSVEDQKTADERIWQLRSTPAAVRFISYEPALGPVINGGHCGDCGTHARVDGRCQCVGKGRLHWWIVGGESGPGARPMHPDWARGLRDQCTAAGVPFFFKQWGGWTETDAVPGGDLGGDMRRGLVRIIRCERPDDGHFRKGDALLRNVGKKAAGRVLDGRTWDEMPTI